MAQVVVTIAGRIYRMNCEDGQEPHLEALAQALDAKMQDLRGAFGEIGELRLTMMTALTIADELSDLKKTNADLNRRLAAMTEEIQFSRSGETAQTRLFVQTLSAASERIERVAQELAAKI